MIPYIFCDRIRGESWPAAVRPIMQFNPADGGAAYLFRKAHDISQIRIMPETTFSCGAFKITMIFYEIVCTDPLENAFTAYMHTEST